MAHVNHTLQMFVCSIHIKLVGTGGVSSHPPVQRNCVTNKLTAMFMIEKTTCNCANCISQTRFLKRLITTFFLPSRWINSTDNDMYEKYSALSVGGSGGGGE